MRRKGQRDPVYAVGTPGVTWHLIAEIEQHTRCGRITNEYPVVKLARDVPLTERCQGPGCRQAWPAPLQAVS